MAPPKPAAPTSSIFDQVMSGEDDANAGLTLARKTADQVSPEQAARILSLEGKTGLPSMFIRENLDEIEKTAGQQDFDAATFRASNPKLSAWMEANPIRYSLVKDDFDQLFPLVSWAEQTSKGIKKGNLEARVRELQAERMSDVLSSGQQSAKHEAEIASLNKELEPLRALDERVGGNFHPLYQFSTQIPNLTRAFIQGGAGDEPVQVGPGTKRAIEGAGAGALVGGGLGALAGGAGAVPGAAAGAATGARLGSIAGMAQYAYRIEAGGAFEDYSKLKDAQGQPLDPRAAAEAAHVVGLVNSALETAGDVVLLKLAKPIGKAAGSIVSDAAAKVITRVPGGAKILSVISSNPKAFTGLTLGQAIREAGKMMVTGQATEVSTEFVQEVVTGVGGEAAKTESGQPFDDQKSMQQIADEATGVIYPTAQATLLFGGLAGGAHVYNTARTIRQGERDKHAYVQAIELTERSKLKTRAPEEMASLVGEVVKGTPVESVYVAPQALETYFQKKGSFGREVAKELGFEKEFDQATETGRKLAIPFAKWTQLQVEHLKGLQDDVTFSEEAVSTNEAKEIQDTVEKDVDAALKAAEVHGEQLAARDTEVKTLASRIEGELTAARPAGILEGSSGEKQYFRQVKDQALLIARISAIEASRRGEGATADQFYDQLKVRFQNEEGMLRVPSKPSELEVLRQEVRGKTASAYERIGNMIDASQLFGQEKMSPNRRARQLREEIGTLQAQQRELNASSNEWENIQSRVADLSERVLELEGEARQNAEASRRTESADASVKADVALGRRIDAMIEKVYVDRKPLDRSNMNDLNARVAQINALFDTLPDGDARIPALQDELDQYQALDLESDRVDEVRRNRRNAGLGVVREDGVEFFQENGGDPFGQVQFGPDESIITLFRKAHASTPVHEFAHVYLKNRFEYVRAAGESATAEVREDWEKLSEWLGITPEQEKLTEEQQEKFAHGFDDYLQNGEAPTEALRKVFARFRRWLTRIYRRVKEARIEIDARAKAIFDRMLATEDEIRAAEASSLRIPLEDALEGVEEADRKRLARLQERAHEDAVETLLKRQLAELRSDRAEFLAEKRKEAEEQARARLQAEPIYAIQDQIREALQSTKSGRGIARDYIDQRMHAKRRTSLEHQAELAGYTSAHHMAQAILEAPPLSEAVETAVRATMATYADLKDTSALREAALEAVNNEHAYELQSLEAEILEKLAEGSEIREEAKKRRHEEAKIEARAIKERARAQLGNARLPGLKFAYVQGSYITARRAAVKAQQAIARGDFYAASVMKRSQMLNEVTAREAQKMIEKGQGWIQYLEDLRAKHKKFYGKEEHFNQVADLLEKLGFPRRDYSSKKKTEGLAQWAARVSQVSNMLNIPDWVLQDGKIRDYREHTIDELRDVINTVKNVVRIARMDDRAMVIDRGALLEEIKGKLLLEMKLGRKGRKPGTPALEPTKADELKDQIARYDLSLKRVQTVLTSIQGFSDSGAWTDIFDKPVHEAANVESELMQADREGLEAAYALYTKKERDALSRRVYQPELGASVSKMNLIMMALNLGNDDNRAKLSGSHPVGVDDSLPWGEHVVMAILQRNLTEKDWHFVQRIWDHLDSKFPAISELHKDVTGFPPDKVPHAPFSVATADGKVVSLSGGYFPLKEDPRASVRASTLAELDQPLYTEQNPGWVAQTKTGHTKTRTGAQYSVSLDPSIIVRHLRDVNHDLAFRRVVIDLRRLVHDKDVQEMLVESQGVEGYRYLREWVNAVAGDRAEVLGVLDKWASALRRHTIVGALALNLGVITQNLANIFLYAGAVEGFGKRRVLRGFIAHGLPYLTSAVSSRTTYTEMRAFVFEASPFMRDKNRSPDYSLAETQARILKQEGVTQDLLDFSAGLMAGTDELTSIPMWISAYKFAQERNQEHDEAVYYADTLIKKTIGSGRRYDTAPIQRGSELSKLLSMFYTFMNTEYNRWSTEGGRAIVEPKARARFFGFVASRILLFNTASILLAGKLPGDDDDQPISWWIKNSLAYPVSFFPGARDAFIVMMDRALGLPGFGYRSTPATAPVEATIEAASQTIAYLNGDRDGQRAAEALSKFLAFATPYPNAINNLFWNAYDTAINDMDPRASDVFRRRPRSER